MSMDKVVLELIYGSFTRKFSAKMNILSPVVKVWTNLLCGYFQRLPSAWIVVSQSSPFQKLNRGSLKKMMRRDIQTRSDIPAQTECTAECSAQIRWKM
jgi:hypothetical protein